MADADIPPVVRELVREHDLSVGSVEIVALLCEADAGYTAEQVAAALYRPAVAASVDLELLARRGLVQRRRQRYRCPPDDAELRRAVKTLAATYRRSRANLVTFLLTRRAASRRSLLEEFGL